jgi:hypothetical protein
MMRAAGREVKMRAAFGLLLVLSAMPAAAQDFGCGPDERFFNVKVPSERLPAGTHIGAASITPTGSIAAEVYFYETHHPDHKFRFGGNGQGAASPSRVVTSSDPIPICVGGPGVDGVDGFAFGVVEPGT